MAAQRRAFEQVFDDHSSSAASRGGLRERVLGDKEYQALENVNTGDQYFVWWNDPGAAAESCARERACDHDHDNEVLFKAAWVMRSTILGLRVGATSAAS